MVESEMAESREDEPVVQCPETARKKNTWELACALACLRVLVNACVRVLVCECL